MRSIRPRAAHFGPSAPHPAQPSGISKAELLVAALVCGLLLIHVERALLASRERSRRQVCTDHLRQLHLGLMSYHDAFQMLPPAGVWRTRPGDALQSLPASSEPAAISCQNWLQLVLPHLGASSLANQVVPDAAIGAPEHAALRTSQLSLAVCPSDAFQTIDNRYVAHSGTFGPVEFARGNYAINGGTHRMARVPGTTADPVPGGFHLDVDADSPDVRCWGNGIAGFNRSFSLGEMTNGQGTLVAIDEVRAGIHPRDPRGVWALGQIGSSVTWAHGMNGDAGRPNAEAPRADDIAGCVELHAALGAEHLAQHGMPCCEYCLQSEQAAARSSHRGGVNALTLDGAVHFIANGIDPGLWHAMHSRETPPDVVKTWSLSASGEHRRRLPEAATQGAERSDPAHGRASLTNSIGMRFVRLPVGRFVMGLPDEELNAVFDTRGASAPHEVEIAGPVWMAVCEVTRQEYLAVTSSAPRDGEGFAEDELRMPVSDVTWDEAAEFCARLSAAPAEIAAARAYRLPTEAEWEYACRAGSTGPHLYIPERQPGDESGENAMKTPPLPIAPVGSYPPNAFGLFDLRGNVWEWCSDWSYPNDAALPLQQNPRGPEHGYLKVVRGSDWLYTGQRCTLGFRATEPWLKSPFIGFRVVCESRATQVSARRQER